MSLQRSGFWAAKFWAANFWAEGFWYEVPGGGSGRKQPIHNYYTRKEIEDLLTEEYLETELLLSDSEQTREEARTNLSEIRASLKEKREQLITSARIERNNTRAILLLDDELRREAIKLWIMTHV